MTTVWARAVADTTALITEATRTGDVRLASDARAGIAEVAERAHRDGAPKADLLDVAECQRRAERALALTIRAGQDAGRIRRRYTDSRADLPSPHEAAGLRERHDLGRYLYSLADGVSDDRFAEVLAECRADGVMSRAYVIRKLAEQPQARDGDGWIPEFGDYSAEAAVRRRELIRQYADQGYSSRQIGEQLSMADDTVRKIARDLGIAITADRVVARSRRSFDPIAAARQTVISIAGLADGTTDLNLDGLTRAEAQEWAASLSDSLRVLNRFHKTIKEKAHL